MIYQNGSPLDSDRSCQVTCGTCRHNRWRQAHAAWAHGAAYRHRLWRHVPRVVWQGLPPPNPTVVPFDKLFQRMSFLPFEGGGLLCQKFERRGGTTDRERQKLVQRP
jgi:hypothetical protein